MSLRDIQCAPRLLSENISPYISYQSESPGDAAAGADAHSVGDTEGEELLPVWQSPGVGEVP